MSTYSETPTTAQADNPRPKHLIRSQYKDIMIKVDDDVYYLDRLQLALKSGYFEKLFIEDYIEKNSDLIELPLMDTDTFSAVVDIIYGEELENVIKPDNFLSLLMAMDYLQMNIDSYTYERFVAKQLGQNSLNNDTFKLYHFIAEDPKFEYLLPVVFEHLSFHLESVKEKISDLDEFLSIKLDHFLQIIKKRRTYRYSLSNSYRGFNHFSNICAKWICHDTENRLIHTTDIINAMRYRFVLSNGIISEDLNISLSTNDEMANQDIVSRYLYNGLVSFGEVQCPMLDILNESEKLKTEQEDNVRSGYYEYDYQVHNHEYLKLETFFRNSYLYDITVSVGEKIYKLHRSVLKSESAYFKEILSIEYSEITAQCEGVPAPPSKDKIYFINEVDSAEFDIIIDYIYLGKEQLTSDTIFRVFKAVHILKIGSMKHLCRLLMKIHYKDLCPKDKSEVMKFTHENVEYKHLHRYYLYKCIVDSWPEVDNLPLFADFFAAITLPGETHVKENEAYLFDKIDKETFKFIVRYIIQDEHMFTKDNILRVLKASETYKIEKLMKRCVDWLISNSTYYSYVSSSDDVVEVLNFTRRNIGYEFLHIVYLFEHLMKWPQVDVEILCTISYDNLENVLMSYDFHVDDPGKILDICSLWVVHDVENRYHLMPRIASAIKRKRLINDDNHSIASCVDFSQCSLDFVKNKLWEILSSTSVLPFALSPENKIKKRRIEQPVFITSKIGGLFSILNSEWDEIVSFRLCENVRVLDVQSRYSYDDDDTPVFRFLMSATMINDNLFILCTISENYYFHAYNFSSKKLSSLACDLQIYKNKTKRIAIPPYRVPLEFTLLNCCNAIYCCFEDGEVLKYSFEYNRWIQISTCLPGKYGICFASDGNQLYRMYKSTRINTTTNYIIDVYDFQQNSWSLGPNLPSLSRRELDESFERYKSLHSLVFLNGHGLAALFSDALYELHREDGWQEDRSLPYDYTDVVKEHKIIHQNTSGKVLFVINNKLYKLSRTQRTWELRKEWSFGEPEWDSGRYS